MLDVTRCHSMRLTAVAALLTVTAAQVSADEQPHAITRRLLRGWVVQGELATRVTPEHGLVVIDHYTDGIDRPTTERRICGSSAVSRYLRQRKSWMQLYLDGDDTVATVTCSNRLGPPRCTLDGIGEFAPRITLEFFDDASSGLQLRVFIALDLNGTSAEFIAQEERAVRRARRRLGGKLVPVHLLTTRDGAAAPRSAA